LFGCRNLFYGVQWLPRGYSRFLSLIGRMLFIGLGDFIFRQHKKK